MYFVLLSIEISVGLFSLIIKIGYLFKKLTV